MKVSPSNVASRRTAHSCCTVAIAAAAANAKQRGLEGKWVISLQNTTQHPAQPSLKNRAVRERLFIASTTRAEHGDANDTREIVRRLAQLRSEKARLLGFANWSSYALDNQMAKTPANATKLLTDMVPAATARARSEIAAMQAVIDRQNGGFKLAVSMDAAAKRKRDLAGPKRCSGAVPHRGRLKNAPGKSEVSLSARPAPLGWAGS